MRDHTKLRAFELADKLALLVYKQTIDFPREEDHTKKHGVLLERSPLAVFDRVG